MLKSPIGDGKSSPIFEQAGRSRRGHVDEGGAGECDVADGVVVASTTVEKFIRMIAAALLEWRERFMLKKVWFDPYQMQAVAQRLTRVGIKVEEYAQTIPNLTAATSNLFDLISARQLVLYPDAAMRQAISLRSSSKVRAVGGSTS